MLKIKQILGEEIAGINDEHLVKLKERVENDHVTWVIGAGVSKSAGVPLWSECLLKMWAQILLLEKEKKEDTKSEFQKALDKLKTSMAEPEEFLEKVNRTMKGDNSIGILSGVNTLEAAEYIQNFMTEILMDNSYYSDKLRDMEYADLVRNALKPDKKPDEIFLKLKNEVIGLLAKYFVQKIYDNKKIEVISYNFDDLLEFALEKEGLNKSDCHIKNPGTKNIIECETGIHIYHPHGTVSVLPTKFSKESEGLVLAEDSYERLERKAYLWENSIQAKALQSTSCIFLGFSGEDYNFRRIIKNMERGKERQQIKHYLFMSIESLVKRMFKNEIDRELLGNKARTEEERKKYLESIGKVEYDKALEKLLNNSRMIYEKMLIIKKLEAQKMYWNSYNIIPIWTTRNELPQMVKKIVSA